MWGQDEDLDDETAIFEKLEKLSEAEQAEFRRENFYNRIDVQSAAELGSWTNHMVDEEASTREPLEEDDFAPRHGISQDANQVVCIWEGSIVTLDADAIVNAANEGLRAGGGICGAIHRATGPLCEEECMTIGRCPTGQTVITKGYRLPARHVLHTVGPTQEIPDLLRSSYITTLDLAAEKGLKSVGLCCVSTGIFGFRLKLATHIALDAVRQWIDAHPGVLEKVVFVMFQAHETSMYEKLMPCYFPRAGDPLPTEGTTPPPVPGMPRPRTESESSAQCAREGCTEPRDGTSAYCSMDCAEEDMED